MPSKQTYDYEAFAPLLKRHRCLWDVNHENYSLGDYRALAFSRIERNMRMYNGAAKQMYTYARANYRNAFIRFISRKDLTRRDRKSLKNYDFLWEVMEENVSKTNKMPKPAWVFSSPPSLAELCFTVIRRNNVLERVLDPLKRVKRTNGTNTDSDEHAENDDTISLLSFEDPISSDEGMNSDSDDTPGLPTYTPPTPTSVVGADLLSTELNQLVVYNPPPWVERPKKVFVRPGMEELFGSDRTCSFRHVPTLPTVPELDLPTILSRLSVWENTASNFPTENGFIDGTGSTCTTDPEMETTIEDDSFEDIMAMETDEKVVHVVFDIDTCKLDKKRISGVKVDVNFNGQGEKRRRTKCCDVSAYKKLRREK